MFIDDPNAVLPVNETTDAERHAGDLRWRRGDQPGRGRLRGVPHPVGAARRARRGRQDQHRQRHARRLRHRLRPAVRRSEPTSGAGPRHRRDGHGRLLERSDRHVDRLWGVPQRQVRHRRRRHLAVLRRRRRRRRRRPRAQRQRAGQGRRRPARRPRPADDVRRVAGLRRRVRRHDRPARQRLRGQRPPTRLHRLPHAVEHGRQGGAGRRCQAPGVLPTPDRPHRSHTFIGVDYDLDVDAYTDLGLSKDTINKVIAERAALLGSAVTMQVDDATDNGDGTQTANVVVTNNLLGHSFPTGFAFARQFWLEVSATDSEGNDVCLVNLFAGDGVDAPCASGVVADRDDAGAAVRPAVDRRTRSASPWPTCPTATSSSPSRCPSASAIRGWPTSRRSSPTATRPGPTRRCSPRFRTSRSSPTSSRPAGASSTAWR